MFDSSDRSDMAAQETGSEVACLKGGGLVLC
jgi:hypothetical protein